MDSARGVGETEGGTCKEEKADKSHLYVFTAHKGGMDDVDKELQLKVIEEMSKNSTHHAAALRKDRKVDERIEAIKEAVGSMTKQEREQREAEKDA
ncbi:hypothetical protein Pmar_PMAR013469 [Perkinsus marinus ATCC 50983]|uniref:Uncharacterized protein n=1 Tax=Perkinsus marinus (strain ATCC 50983 / TXsc) TaxID=423536 RepID=C5L1X6_PERM5|nr:hypothetical protein Pmar_PMAR013469 [Perkinsus marinus ATCC 50983]EER09245.1 hypothetical protein Pmar_PMAR013469 [Perkinsus marinus ATCC 50983]|eukprot:XP_002777429.1 hypothetical protein Pmar_PMAR013469 [Perkinsus marinus ATCC 50983]